MGMILCLRTAATNGPIVYAPGDMWTWIAIVVMMPAGDNSSTRAIWQTSGEGGGMTVSEIPKGIFNMP
jgi:hypothetical protein